jgi:RNase P subunit RPR2
MPQKIFCSNCQHVLYQGLELEIPVEIVSRNGGYCPNCGKKIVFNPDSLIIKPNENYEPKK